MGTWDKTFPSGIPPKPRHRGTASTVGTKVFVMGGCIDNNEQVDDLALFNTSMYTISSLRPLHMYKHFKCTSPTLIYISLLRSSPIISYTIRLALKSWTKPKPKGASPAPRSGHTAAVHDNKIYVFGGETASGPTADHFVLDTGKLTSSLSLFFFSLFFCSSR